jgi:hypothetical protein
VRVLLCFVQPTGLSVVAVVFPGLEYAHELVPCGLPFGSAFADLWGEPGADVAGDCVGEGGRWVCGFGDHVVIVRSGDPRVNVQDERLGEVDECVHADTERVRDLGEFDDAEVFAASGLDLGNDLPAFKSGAVGEPLLAHALSSAGGLDAAADPGDLVTVTDHGEYRHETAAT